APCRQAYAYICSPPSVVITIAVSFFFQAEDGIRDGHVTGVQTCALPISAGTAALGNASDGMRISGNASSNSVGGTAAGAGNTIANNGAGVVIDSGTGNSVLSNSIHSSGALGINLGVDGHTANDLDDPDTGANNLQN